MSVYIPVEREHIYKDFGVEDALEDLDPSSFKKPFLVDDRKDSFGNTEVLMWDPQKEEAHLLVEGLDIRTSGKGAYDALYHTYPVVASKLGESAVISLTHEDQIAAYRSVN